MQASQDRLAVLLVDGDRRVRAAMVKLFTAAEPQWDVVAAADPICPPDLTPDIALVDLSRNNLRAGLSLITSLRAANVVVLATSTRDGLRAEALAAGAAAFVPKDSHADYVQAVRTAAHAIDLRPTARSAPPG